jgi:hypothetical protein
MPSVKLGITESVLLTLGLIATQPDLFYLLTQ